MKQEEKIKETWQKALLAIVKYNFYDITETWTLKAGLNDSDFWRDVEKALKVCQKETKRELMKIIERVKKDNPYPDDIFQKNEFGKFGRLVWNNCCDKILEEIREVLGK